MMVSVASAQVADVTVTVPAGPPGAVQATVNGVACGAPGTVSLLGTTTLTLPASCATAGSTVSFNSNGVPLASTLQVPASGGGSLVLGSLDPTNAVNITIPAAPAASGTVSAVVNGQVCGTATVSQTAMTTISLPATCATPGATISFTSPGGALISTLTVPATGAGGTLTLPSLAGSSPVTVTLPAGTGTLTIEVNGEACGSATLSATSVTAVILPETCAVANGVVTFTNSAGQQLAAVPSISATGDGNLTIASLAPAQVSVVLPAGQTGTITVMGGGTVCGSGTISPTGSTTIMLAPACSVPGLTLSFSGGSNVPLASTLQVPSTITTANGTLTLPSLNAAIPLTVLLPPGTGTVSVTVGGTLCATAVLSSTGTRIVTIPVTCALAGQPIAFSVAGVPAAATLTVPASGSGALVVSSLAPLPAAPVPAATGNAGSIPRDSVPGWIVALLALTVTGGVVGLRSVTQRR
jgi:hypothetical protein